jgi:predicted ArsR family transcriptional regulator
MAGPPGNLPDVGGTTDATPPSGRRQDVLRLLRSSESPLSIGELARRLGVHPNTVRLHLDVLVDAGRVERADVPRSGPGRPPLMFRASRRMDPAGLRNYRFLAEMLITELSDAHDPTARAIAIGRRWAVRDVEPPAAASTPAEVTTWLIGLLDRVGFAPEAGAREGEIDLRNCPFLEAVQPPDRLVCALHLGFMRGAADRAGRSVSVDELIPFAEPDLCRVVLGARG